METNEPDPRSSEGELQEDEVELTDNLADGQIDPAEELREGNGEEAGG